VDDAVAAPIARELFGREWIPPSPARDRNTRYLDTFIELWYGLGYDFVRFERGLPFPERHIFTADTAPGATSERSWADEHRGAITSWEEFERYPWPRVEEFDFFPYEYIASHLPEGMGFISCHAAGVFEHLSWIMSYEGLSLALHDDPALVRAVSDRVGELLVGFYRHLLDLPGLVAVFPGDDMGFRSGTLIGPDEMKSYCLGWHRTIAAMTHERGLPYFLHSCGNLERILEDLIDWVGIDGRHSTEDAIMPVERFQERYGKRIAVLGGVDINILTLGTEAEVRARTRALIERCGSRGRYAVGSGNSIPSYVPVASYLAMLDEAVEARRAARLI
jgi:uroporphyrinogen decarboxylase